MRYVVSVILSSIILLGQSLSVPPSQTPGAFSVAIQSPPGKSLLALQWDFSVPPAIAITPADISVSKEAEAAGKFLTCSARAARTPKPRRIRYTCILVGGRKPIADGPVAVVKYRAQWDVKDAPVGVGIESVLGVSADQKRVSIPSVEATINVR